MPEGGSSVHRADGQALQRGEHRYGACDAGHAKALARNRGEPRIQPRSALLANKLLWQDGMSKETLLPMLDWETLATASIVSPGICVTFAPPGKESRRLCSQIEALGVPAPAQFASAYNFLFGPPLPVKRYLTLRDRDAGFVLPAAEPDAALRLAWRKVSIVAGVAAAMAAGIAVLATLMIGHALIPARTIIDGLRRLQQGDLSWRLPRFRTGEFNLIARAFNELSEDLKRTNAARAALTTRLFEVQEEERRALARDLHDEFGQCLSATAALAASIEAGAPPRARGSCRGSARHCTGPKANDGEPAGH